MLIVAIVLSAVLAILSYYLGPAYRWAVYIFKPFTTGLIIVLALSAPASSKRYKSAILTGLVCSLAGDVFLMLPGDHFLEGLVSFLLAHVCYLFAFTVGVGFSVRYVPYLVYAILAGGILTFLWPGIPAALRIPVIIYVALLASMASQAAARWQVLRQPATVFAAAGGLLFVMSDAMLASDRFGFPFAGSSALVLATYYAAQLLIAKSINSAGEA